MDTKTHPIFKPIEKPITWKIKLFCITLIHFTEKMPIELKEHYTYVVHKNVSFSLSLTSK
jgi:hypothetical protein